MREPNTQYTMRNAHPWLNACVAYCVLTITYCALLTGCAQIVTPDGGPKDVLPPVAIKYAPDSAATNFHGTKIVITFDEYIALNDLNKQLIISPAVKRKPEVTIRKKDLVIQFKDSLEPNTTYSISFGNSIRDITENNALKNFRYVFSTGSAIDSLKFSGQVINAQTLSGEKNVLVMLYRNTGDSVPYQEKPYYYTRTDDNGNFLMTNLAPAKYKLFALADEGDDYLFNTPDERIAFSDTLIHLANNIDSARMLMFRERQVAQRLLKSGQLAPGRIQFLYNLPIENPSLEITPTLPSSMQKFVQYSKNNDTIDVWLSKIELDSVTFIVKSDGNVLDSVAMKLVKPGSKKSVRGGTGENLLFQHNVASGKLLPGHQLKITTANPIRSIDSSKIILIRSGDTLKPGRVLSASQRELRFDIPFPEDSSFTLFVPPGAIIDWLGQKNDTMRAKFTVLPLRQFGNLTVKIPELAPGNYLLEVVDDKDRVVRDTIVKSAAMCEFTLLAPGNYRIRLVHDTNRDDRWTPGNYLAKQPPERVIYYNTTVRIRAGWDMDVEWRLPLQ